MSEEESVDDKPVEMVLEVHSIESSEDPPIDQWSSLLIPTEELNKKKQAFEQGLYSPGSGEICAKYIPLSDSSMFLHSYYNYPAVTDPGIEEALLESAEEIIYPDDGQQYYLDLCEKMNFCVVRLFLNGLLTSEIDLSYYCVAPEAVIAMGKALKYNKTVETLNFTDNFLSVDSCYHLGEMLTSNITLTELNLDGCRIGPRGLRNLFAGLIINRTLQRLNLNRNMLTDEGGALIAFNIERGLSVKEISLKSNDLQSKTASAMAEAFEAFNSIRCLDLSWNSFCSPVGTVKMLKMLQENEYLEELDLSWNSMSGPKLANAIKGVMLAPKLRVLKLANNNFSDEAIDIILNNLNKAKYLHTFSLADNPLTVDDAYKTITKLRMVACKVKSLHLNNIAVDHRFLAALDRIKNMKSKKGVTVTFGNIIPPKIITGPDPRDTLLNRVEYLSEKKSKKNKVDVPLIILQLFKDGNVSMDLKSFQQALYDAGARMLDSDLVETLVDTFAKSKKGKIINIEALVDYIKRKYPERKLPPNPPPPSQPQPQPTATKKK